MGNSAASTLNGQRRAARCEYIDLFCKEVRLSFSFDGQCIDISENWPSVSGYDVYECLFDNLYSHIRSIDQKKVRQIIEQQSLPKKVRFRMRHQAGHWDWYEINAIRVEEDAVHLAAAKISEEVTKENDLQKASLEAELALKGQSEFFAHISHELRTPLNAIVGFSQMMQQGVFGEIDNPRYRDYVSLLERSGQDLLCKINDLLEISSLCAGIDKLNESPLSLQELVKSIVDAHSRELFCRHIQLSIDIQPLTIMGDRSKLLQAISHLLKNAMKFSPEGSTIRLRSHIADNGDLQLLLCDEGKGFSPEQLHYLKGQSRQFKLAERHRRMMGFGLPLADELIRLHGGQISYKNKESHGAELAVHIPAKRLIHVKREAARTKPKPSYLVGDSSLVCTGAQ